MKLKKPLLWIVGSLVSVGVLGAIAVALFFPAEKLRLMIEERATAELQRPVSIGSVGVSFWGGLGASVADIQVGDTTDSIDKQSVDDGLYASVESVDIKVQFWPLFSGQYVIDRLIVNQPLIRISNQGEGNSHSQSVDGSSVKSVTKADVTGAKLALGGLSFGNLEIRDGSIERFEAASGSRVTISGFDFKGNLSGLNDSSQSGMYQSVGTMSFDSIAFGSENDMMSVVLPSIAMAYDIIYNSVEERLSLKEGQITFVGAGGSEGSLNVKGEFPFSDEQWNSGLLSVSGKAPFALLASVMPNAGKSDYSGEVELDLTIKGALWAFETAKVEGRLAIIDGGMAVEQSEAVAAATERLEKLNAEFLIYPSRIEIKTLAFEFSESDLELSGVITNPFPYMLPVSQWVRDQSTGPYLQFEALSKRLNIDRLFPEATPGGSSGRGAGDSTDEAVVIEQALPPIFLPEMKGSGTVKIDTLIYTEIEFSSVQLDVRIERRRIFCENARGLVFEGEFDGKALIDLTDLQKPHYSGSYSAHNLNMQKFVGRFAPWDGAGILSGEMSASGSYAASGWQKEEFISGLTMDILSNADSLQFTSEVLSQSLVSSIKRLSGKELANDKYKTLDLRSFTSSLRFVNGKLQVDTLRGFSSEIGQWNLQGTIDLDGVLSLSGILVPTKSTIRVLTPKNNALAGALAGFLSSMPEGSVRVPFTVSGTIAKPVPAFNIDAINKALAKTLKEQGANFLKGLFGN